MASYAKQFLASITKKSYKKRASPKLREEQTRQVSNSKKNEIDDVQEWKVLEEKYQRECNESPPSNEPKDYEIIYHEEEKEEEKKNSLNAYLYKNSPLNNLYPISRFNLENNTIAYQNTEPKKVNDVEEVFELSDGNENSNEEEKLNEQIQKEEENSKTNSKEEKKCQVTLKEKESSLENDLNVTEDQMNDLKVEVNQIHQAMKKEKQLVKQKKSQLLIKGAKYRNELLKKKSFKSKEESKNPRHMSKNEISKNNNSVVVNNTNQYIYGGYPPNPNELQMMPYPPNTNGLQMMPYPPNSNGLQMMPYPCQMPIINNQITYQMQNDSYPDPNVNPQPFYFNPAFPTELPYIPPVSQKQNNTIKNNVRMAKKNNQVNSSLNFLQNNPLTNLIPIQPQIEKQIEKPKLKRDITYIPRTIKDYKEKYDGKNNKKSLGGLGPNIGTLEWNEKHQKALKKKEYSNSVDTSNKNNIKIIHYDHRLEKRKKTIDEEKDKPLQNEEDSLTLPMVEDESQPNDNYELPVNPDLNDNDLQIIPNPEYKNKLKSSQKHLNTQENSKKKEYSLKKPPVRLPKINKRIAQSSSQNNHKYKNKPKNYDDDESQQQFTNENLNKLYHNHQSFNCQVNQIKASIYK